MKFLRENRILFGASILAILLIVALLSFLYISNTAQTRVLSSVTVSLESQVSEKKLVWKNEQALDNIIEDLRINLGVIDQKNNKIVNINSIKVIYTPNVQNLFTTLSQDNKVISSGDYTINGNQLLVYISLNQNLLPSKDNSDEFLNSQLIRVLAGSSSYFVNQSIDTGYQTQANNFSNFFQSHFFSDGKNQTQPYPIALE